MIRKATIEDAQEMAIMLIDNWKVAYKNIVNDEFLNTLNYTDKQKEQEEYLKMDNSHVFLYIDDESDEILGIVAYEEKQDEIEIVGFDVRLEYRRKGIGSFMFEFLKEVGYKAQSNKIVFWCLADDLPTVSFLQYVGADLVGEKRRQVNEQSIKELKFEYML